MGKEIYNQKYKDNQNILRSKEFIDSFIEFFGEDYRDIITSEILGVPIIWYIPAPIDINTSILDCIITDLPENELRQLIEHVQITQLQQSVYNPIYNFLVLPIDFNVSHVIHEVLHLLTCHILRKQPTLIILNGISFFYEKYEGFFEEQGLGLNEIINQRMSKDIESIYMKKVKFESSVSYQDMFFPLIERFYNSFKEEIKKTEITGNLDYLLDTIGYDEFQSYQHLFFRLIFKLSRSKQEGADFSIDNSFVDEANRIVVDMINNSQKLEPIK